MKNLLLCAVCICVLMLCRRSECAGTDVTLPQGSAPAAITTRHFPDRVHEFVWRNWNLVEPAKLAKVVDASVSDIMAVAKSMGLPDVGDIPKEMKTRGYITVIRRNWHLLPYDQLLELLEMTPEQLAVMLREDDFLWIKLGMLKPKCEPLRYTAPDETARRRAAEIKAVVEEVFGEEIRREAEPRFTFVRQFRDPLPSLSPPKAADKQDAALRFVYSYFAVYGDPLLNPELDPYPDGLLQRLSSLGVNGVWLHVVLRDLAPGGTTFPEFGVGREKRVANLRSLVERAKKYGVSVYLYINEPRAMPAAFFQNRPEMAGIREGEVTAICTSHAAVRKWISDAMEFLFRQVPDLGGVFTITASENLTNCASHEAWRSCPHCKGRSDAEIIAEVNAAIEEGVHRGNPMARVIVWDWGWRGHGDSPAPDIVARLPNSVWLMSVSEWARPIERAGVRTSVGEYSLSAVGPGPRASLHWEAARKAGFKTVAKVQLNNSWELSSLPYLPVMDLVAEHCHNLASANVDGTMLSWTLGGYPSPNLEIAARFYAKPTPDVAEVLDAVARERFGPVGAPSARRAWTAFSMAFREYPYHAKVLYYSPVEVGPANPLYLDKTGYAATMVGIPYDDLPSWRGPYAPEMLASQFEKLAKGFQTGVADLQAAVEKAPPDHRIETQAELRFAQAAAIHFQSVANQTRFVLARDALAEPSTASSAEERQNLRAEITHCLQSEIVLARQLFALVTDDSRIGFEASNHYIYLPLDMVEKVINCRWLLDQFGVTTEAFAREVDAALPEEKPYDCHKRLSEEPIHVTRRNPDAKAQAGEFQLPEQGWKLVWNHRSSPVIRDVVGDFQDYLATSMRVRVELESCDSLKSWQSMDRRIIVGTRNQMPGCGMALRGSKDYEIVATPNRITMCGYDERGAMFGLYNLEARMNLREAPFLPTNLKSVRHCLYDTRMVHSWLGWMEWPDRLLSHLAHDGFDSIYASCYANPNGDCTTAESSTDFYARMLFQVRRQDPARMRDLIKRASRFGIKVYAPIVYQSVGTAQNEAGLRTLVRNILNEFPDIRGYVLLTEGFWYKEWGGCHGKSREYSQDWARNWSRAVGIVAEECHRVNPAIEVLPWEYNIDFRPQNVNLKRFFIQQLPTDTIPMLTWENGKSFELDGMQGYLRDYSLSQIGPAEVTEAQIDEARQRKMKVYCKADTFASWQFGTVPYLPFPHQCYQRYKALERLGVNGTMESWSSGYTPNFMTELRAWYCWTDSPPLEELLGSIAARDFGSEGKEKVLEAWDRFSRAIRLVPDTGPNMGTNNAVGNPLFFQEPPLRTATFKHSWVDHDKWMGYLGGSINPYWPFTFTRMVFYPDFMNQRNLAEIYARDATGVDVASATKVLPVFLKYLRQASDQMEEGLKLYRAAALASPKPKRQRAVREAVIAEHLQRMMQSECAILEFEDLRLQLAAEQDGHKANAILDRMKTILREEIARTERSLLAATRDSRLGFQFEQDYVYTPYSLREKLGNLRETLEKHLQAASPISDSKADRPSK